MSRHLTSESNGLAELAEETPRVVEFSGPALRRIARLHARVEGAVAVAQAAQQVAQVQQQALHDDLAEILAEHGVDVAALGNAPLNIDWRTGVLRLP